MIGSSVTHIDSSYLMDNYSGGNTIFNGSDVVALNGNPLDPVNTDFSGLLMTYQPDLPGFGGSIIVAGVEGMEATTE